MFMRRLAWALVAAVIGTICAARAEDYEYLEEDESDTDFERPPTNRGGPG